MDVDPQTDAPTWVFAVRVRHKANRFDSIGVCAQTIRSEPVCVLTVTPSQGITLI
jgi:hypothetical protein